MTDTYRAVYALKIKTTIYVLHAFQKKSKTGKKTPKRDIDLIRERLKNAEIQAFLPFHTIQRTTQRN